MATEGLQTAQARITPTVTVEAEHEPLAQLDIDPEFRELGLDELYEQRKAQEGQFDPDQTGVVPDSAVIPDSAAIELGAAIEVGQERALEQSRASQETSDRTPGAADTQLREEGVAPPVDEPQSLTASLGRLFTATVTAVSATWSPGKAKEQPTGTEQQGAGQESESLWETLKSIGSDAVQNMREFDFSKLLTWEGIRETARSVYKWGCDSVNKVAHAVSTYAQQVTARAAAAAETERLAHASSSQSLLQLANAMRQVSEEMDGEEVLRFVQVAPTGLRRQLEMIAAALEEYAEGVAEEERREQEQDDEEEYLERRDQRERIVEMVEALVHEAEDHPALVAHLHDDNYRQELPPGVLLQELLRILKSEERQTAS